MIVGTMGSLDWLWLFWCGSTLGIWVAIWRLSVWMQAVQSELESYRSPVYGQGTAKGITPPRERRG